MSGVKWAAFGMWTLSGMALVLVDSVFLHDIHVMLPVGIKNRIKNISKITAEITMENKSQEKSKDTFFFCTTNLKI